MSQHPTEFGAVQKPLITYAGQIGWDFVSRDDAVTLRKGETGILFYDFRGSCKIIQNSHL